MTRSPEHLVLVAQVLVASFYSMKHCQMT